MYVTTVKATGMLTDDVALIPDDEPRPGYAFLDYSADEWDCDAPNLRPNEEPGLAGLHCTPAVAASLQDLLSRMRHSRLARQRYATMSSPHHHHHPAPAAVFEIWRVHAFEASHLHNDLHSERSVLFHLWQSRSRNIEEGDGGSQPRTILTGSDVSYWIRAIRARAASTSTKVVFLLSHEGAVTGNPMYQVIMALVTVKPSKNGMSPERWLKSHTTSVQGRMERRSGDRKSDRCSDPVKVGSTIEQCSAIDIVSRLFCLTCKKVPSSGDSSDLTLYSF